MNTLSIRRGKVPIVVWGRGHWQSMPHTVLMSEVGAITAVTRCGREVILSGQVPRICLTQLPADLFVAVGCGLCARAFVADLRAEALAAMPDAKARLAKVLARAAWAEIPAGVPARSEPDPQRGRADHPPA